MVKRKTSRKTPAYMKFSLWAVLIAILAALFVFIKVYQAIFSPSFDAENGDSKVL